MKHRLRLSSATVALALCSAAPALAQDSDASSTTSVAIPAAPSSTNTVGDARLRDFSLSGTVTKPAESAPSTARPQPAAQQPQTEIAQPARAATAPAATAAAAPQRIASVAPRTAERSASAAPVAANAFTFPPPTPSTDASASLGPDPLAPRAASSPAGDPIAAQSIGENHWVSLVPWLVALLAALGAAAWYFRRQRSGYAFAGAGGDVLAFDPNPAPAPPARPAPPRPAPAPQPAPPRARTPAPAPAPSPAPVSKGVVSTRLRPWLDIQFAPDRIEIGEERATIHFMIEVYNSGSAPARDVLVEALIFNAGPDQDAAIERFFAKPGGDGERVAVIAPLQRMNFQSAVSVPRDQMRIFEVGGRKVFVPLIGFNAYYRWGGGEGQTSASYLLGRDTAGDKMSPFRVDIGSRTFRGLGAREHTLRVRK